MTNQELLKVYSAYLPYGVEVLVDDGNGIYTDFITGIGVIDDMIFLDKTGDWYYNDVNDFTAKLILRPLSDLTKWIEHNGEKFVPVDKLNDRSKFMGDQFKIYIDIDGCTRLLYIGQPNRDFIRGLNPKEKLIEWHFDVFELIGTHAINLNEVK